MEPTIPQNVGTIPVTGLIQGGLLPCPGPQQISYLIDLLAKERANLSTEYNWRLQLGLEVEKVKQELFRQKKLMEMFISRADDTKQELERLQNNSNAETLSTAKIASEVNNTIKRRNKKDLEKDYEELQVAYIINLEKLNNEIQEKDKHELLQEKLENIRASDDEPCQSHVTNQKKVNDEIQEERKKNKALEEEVIKLKNAYKQISQTYEADVTARLKADHLQRELEEQIKFHEKKTFQDELVMKNLRDERDSLFRQMEDMRLKQQKASEEEFNSELQEEEKDNILQEELMKLRASDDGLNQSQAKNQEEFNTEQQEEEIDMDFLKEDLEKHRATHHKFCHSHGADVSSNELNGESEDDVTKEESLSSVLPKKPNETSVFERIRIWFRK